MQDSAEPRDLVNNKISIDSKIFADNKLFIDNKDLLDINFETVSKPIRFCDGAETSLFTDQLGP